MLFVTFVVRWNCPVDSAPPYLWCARNVDPVIATRFVFTSIILITQKTLLIVARFAARLTYDVLELYLDLLPVHHVPPIGNVFGSLVVILEVIRVFPNIET